MLFVADVRPGRGEKCVDDLNPKFTFGRLVFYRIVINILGMFDMSADPTGWTITLIVAIGFLGIVAIARWLLR